MTSTTGDSSTVKVYTMEGRTVVVTDDLSTQRSYLLKAGVQVDVFRRTGNWSRGVVEEVTDKIIIVALLEGQKKDIPTESIPRFIRIPQYSFLQYDGCIPCGDDIWDQGRFMTVEEAKDLASTYPDCQGFTYHQVAPTEKPFVYFKKKWSIHAMGAGSGWTSFQKIPAVVLETEIRRQAEELLARDRAAKERLPCENEEVRREANQDAVGIEQSENERTTCEANKTALLSESAEMKCLRHEAEEARFSAEEYERLTAVRAESESGMDSTAETAAPSPGGLAAAGTTAAAQGSTSVREELVRTDTPQPLCRNPCVLQ